MLLEKELKERGLAGAGETDDADALAAFDLEREVADHIVVTVREGDAAQRDRLPVMGKVALATFFVDTHGLHENLAHTEKTVLADDVIERDARELPDRFPNVVEVVVEENEEPYVVAALHDAPGDEEEDAKTKDLAPHIEHRFAETVCMDAREDLLIELVILASGDLDKPVAHAKYFDAADVVDDLEDETAHVLFHGVHGA
jgi:hypothetical protein